MPGLGVGYYSRELDAIVTYGPSQDYAGTVGVRIRQDHPGRIVAGGLGHLLAVTLELAGRTAIKVDFPGAGLFAQQLAFDAAEQCAK